MRTDMPRLVLTAALFVGGLALFVAGFVIALEVRSVLATPPEAPAAQPPNPGHGYEQIELPPGTWPGLDADRLDGLEASEVGGIKECVNIQEGLPKTGTGDYVCQTLGNGAFCVSGITAQCGVGGGGVADCAIVPGSTYACWRCCK